MPIGYQSSTLNLWQENTKSNTKQWPTNHFGTKNSIKRHHFICTWAAKHPLHSFLKILRRLFQHLGILLIININRFSRLRIQMARRIGIFSTRRWLRRLRLLLARLQRLLLSRPGLKQAYASLHHGKMNDFFHFEKKPKKKFSNLGSLSVTLASNLTFDWSLSWSPIDRYPEAQLPFSEEDLHEKPHCNDSGTEIS